MDTGGPDFGPYGDPLGPKTKVVAVRSTGEKIGWVLIGLFAIGIAITGTLVVTKSTSSPAVVASPTTSAAAPTTEAAPSTTVEPTTTERETTTTTEPPPPTTRVKAAAQTYAGSGDRIVTLTEPINEPRVATLTHTGQSNFIVHSLGASERDDDSLVNEIGPYNGTVGFAFDGGRFTRVEIKADGAWTLTIKDILDGRFAAGNRIDGQGDDVVVLVTDERTPAAIACPGCTSNFIVHAYGSNGRDSVVNEIGSYNGTVLIPADTLVLQVHAGPGRINGTRPSWSVTLQP